MTLSLSKPAAGSVGWAAAINQNWTDIEDAINGGGGGAPTGSITMYGAGTAPTGWLLCDGTAVSRSTYAALFAVVGTSFGAGDGSTTFNLPDLRGRSPLGTGQGSGLTNRTLGANVGAETHALSTSEIPSHSHSVTDPGHSHWVQRFAGGAGSGNWVIDSSSIYNSSRSTDSATTGITIQNTGGGSAHNTMHPCQVVTFIIKT